MHKKNLHRNTDSIRIARAAQVRLDEISDKIEREKHKGMKSNYHEKVKIWNELKSIRRVFEPLYVLKDDQERLANDQSAAKRVTGQNEGRRACNLRVYGKANAFVKQPRLLQRKTETQSSSFNVGLQRRHTEPTITEGKMLLTQNSKIQTQQKGTRDDSVSLRRPRSYTWSPVTSNEPSGTLPAPNEREHLAKLRTAAEQPRVSDSMSSVTMGYLAFKRVLKNKQQAEIMERKVVDSKFRLMSMDEAELSANSRLLVPEQSDLTEDKIDVTQETFTTQSNPHLVKKDNKNRPGLTKHRSASVGKRQISSSLSWPLGELPMRSPETRRRSLLTPDLSRVKSTDVPPKVEISEMKIGKTKRRKAFLSDMRERSSESDEEEKFGTFNEIPKQKTKLNTTKKHTRLKAASKLLKPLGTGCFSESFQAVNQ